MENQTPEQNQVPNQYQNQYQYQNQNQNYVAQKNQSTISIGDWVVTFILLIIPLVNIIMLFVWAFGGSTPESKANFAKAQLIFWLISVILIVIFYGTIFALIVGAASYR